MMKKIVLVVWLALTPSFSWAGFSGGGTVSPCSGDLSTSCQVTGLHLGVTRILCSIRAANFNITTDQACAIPASITAWVPTSILVTNCSGTFTLAAGGVYSATSKGGTAPGAAARAYTA